jgi:hypothetical protein
LLYYDEMSTYIRDGPYCTFSLITSPFPGDLGRITALARLRYRRHIVFDFSHTFGSFTYRRHIVFDFSHTFGSFTLQAAHCIRFFAYIWLVYVTGGTLYSIFRIHLARLRYRRHSMFHIHLAHLRHRRHIVFDFSHTFGSFTTPSAHCIRFFTYIWLIYVTGGTLYSIFRIHLARLRYRRTLYSIFRIHLARLRTGGTLYSVFRIHSARLRYWRHIVFDFSHTFVRRLD